MFMLRKFVAHILFPVPLTVEVLLLGLYLVWFTRRQRAAKVVITLGTLWLGVVSNSWVAERLIRVLEDRYPPFVVSERARDILPAPGIIAVLGGFANNDPRVPASSHVSPELMVRLVEGIRLYHALPGSKLVLSGYAGSAEGMAEVAEAVGVNPPDIIPVPQPRDTEQEARLIGAIAGQRPLILVTSAAHMPRAIGLFKKVGVQAQPAPTDYLAPRHPPTADDFFPSPASLVASQTAFYEYMGLAWAKLLGKI
jgi:uncharacterized SAM-binding protein YcdF (DUF218 family)